MSLLYHETCQLLGLELYNWKNTDDTKIKVPFDEGLFIFKVKPAITKISKVFSINFKHSSLLDHDVRHLARKLFAKTKFFSPSTSRLLGKQVFDFIRSCYSFHNSHANTPPMQGNCNLVFVANIDAVQVTSYLDNIDSYYSSVVDDEDIDDIYHEAISNSFLNDRADREISGTNDGEINPNDDDYNGDHIPRSVGLFDFVDYARMPRSFWDALLESYLDVSQDYSNMVVMDHGNACLDLDGILSVLKSRYEIKGFCYNSDESMCVVGSPLLQCLEVDRNNSNAPANHELGQSCLVQINPAFEVIQARNQSNSCCREKDFGRDGLCSICLDLMSLDVDVVKMDRCQHMFHRKCLFEWVLKNPSCPYCRSSSLTNVFVATSCN